MVDDEFAALVRRHRSRARQADFGREVARQGAKYDIHLAPISRSTVHRWECGFPPSDLYAVLISDAVGVKVTELGRYVGRDLTPERVQEVIARAARRTGASAGQETSRDDDVVLGGLAARGVNPAHAGLTLDWERLGTMLHATQSVDACALRDLQLVTKLWIDQIGHLSPRALLPQLCSHLIMLRSKIVTTDQRHIKQELAQLAGRTAVASGVIWHGLQDLGEANEAFNFALELSNDMRDGPLRAMALTSKALLASRGLHEEGLPAEPGWAMTLMREAERAIGEAATPEMRAWLLSSRAWEGASRHDELSARRDLESAWRALAEPSSQEGFFMLMDAKGQLLLYEGKCAVLLGRMAEGIRLMEQAMTQTAQSSPHVRLWVAMDLAGALLQAQEIDHAVGLLADAWHVVSANSITKFVRRIQRFSYQELAPHRDQPAVRALTEQIAGERDRKLRLLRAR